MSPGLWGHKDIWSLGTGLWIYKDRTVFTISDFGIWDFNSHSKFKFTVSLALFLIRLLYKDPRTVKTDIKSHHKFVISLEPPIILLLKAAFYQKPYSIPTIGVPSI